MLFFSEQPFCKDHQDHKTNYQEEKATSPTAKTRRSLLTGINASKRAHEQPQVCEPTYFWSSAKIIKIAMRRCGLFLSEESSAVHEGHWAIICACRTNPICANAFSTDLRHPDIRISKATSNVKMASNFKRSRSYYVPVMVHL